MKVGGKGLATKKNIFFEAREEIFSPKYVGH